MRRIPSFSVAGTPQRIPGFLLPRASGCSHLGAARVDAENRVSQKRADLGETGNLEAVGVQPSVSRLNAES